MLYSWSNSLRKFARSTSFAFVYRRSLPYKVMNQSTSVLAPVIALIIFITIVRQCQTTYDMCDNLYRLTSVRVNQALQQSKPTITITFDKTSINLLIVVIQIKKGCPWSKIKHGKNTIRSWLPKINNVTSSHLADTR